MKSSYQMANTEIEKQVQANNKNSRNKGAGRNQLRGNTVAISAIKNMSTQNNTQHQTQLNTAEFKQNALNQNQVKQQSRNKTASKITDNNSHFKTAFIAITSKNTQNTTIKNIPGKSVEKKDEPMEVDFNADKKRGVIDMNIKSDKRLYHPTATQNKLIEKIINNIKDKFDKEITDKRYPHARIREDVWRILFKDPSIKLSWDSLNNSSEKIEKAFDKHMRLVKANAGGIIDLNKINSLIESSIPNPKRNIEINNINTNGTKHDIDNSNNIKKQEMIFNEKINQYNDKIHNINNNELKESQYVKDQIKSEENIQNIRLHQKPIISEIEESVISPKEQEKVSNQKDVGNNNATHQENQQLITKIPFTNEPNLIPQNQPVPSTNHVNNIPLVLDKQTLKQNVYNQLLSQEIEKTIKIKHELESYNKNIVRGAEENNKFEKMQKEEKRERVHRFKAVLDKQVLEKNDVKKISLSKKKVADDQIVLEAIKEKEIEKQKLIEKFKVKQEQKLQLQKHQAQKQKLLKEEKEKERKQNLEIEKYNKEKLVTEIQEKKQLLSKQQKHWQEFKENNERIKKEKLDRKKFEVEIGKKAIKDLDDILAKQEASRNQERNRVNYNLTHSYSVKHGVNLEKKRQEDLLHEEENRVKAEIEKTNKEYEKEKEKSLDKKKKISSLREGLNKQILEKKNSNLENKKKDHEYFSNVILKTNKDFNEEKQRIANDFSNKKESYKKELEKQIQEKEKLKLLNNYGITNPRGINLK